MCYVKITTKQVIIALVIFILPGCEFKTAQDYLNEADQLSEQKRYKQAIELLNKAIEKDSKYLGAYINRGADKSALGDFKGAIEDYNKVLKIDPQNTLAIYNIGNNYKRLDDFLTAVQYYNKALGSKGGQFIYLDFTPNSFIDRSLYDVPAHEIYYERGIAFYRINSLRSAFYDFSAAIRGQYRIAESNCWLGYIYAATGQKDLACELFTLSKQLGDHDAEEELKKYCNE